jgi:hypothetical protein
VVQRRRLLSWRRQQQLWLVCAVSGSGTHAPRCIKNYQLTPFFVDVVTDAIGHQYDNGYVNVPVLNDHTTLCTGMDTATCTSTIIAAIVEGVRPTSWAELTAGRGGPRERRVGMPVPHRHGQLRPHVPRLFLRVSGGVRSVGRHVRGRPVRPVPSRQAQGDGHMSIWRDAVRSRRSRVGVPRPQRTPRIVRRVPWDARECRLYGHRRRAECRVSPWPVLRHVLRRVLGSC